MRDGKAGPRAIALAFACWLLGAAGASGQQAEPPLINNVFVDTFITEALRDVAFQAGVNIIPDVSVQGFVTLDLVDVPLEDALQMILAPGGYTYTKLDEDTYLVGLADPAQPTFHLLSETIWYRFQFITAESAKRLIPLEHQKYVKFDPEQNVAVVTAAPEFARRIVADLKAMDAPPPQVVIEALVTEVSEAGRTELAIDWSWNSPVSNFAEDFVDFTELTGSIGYIPAGGLDTFFTRLRTVVDRGQAKIHANPRIAVLSGEEARIFIGKQRYYRITTGSDDNPFTRLQPIDVGVSLTILPRIADNGDITIHIEPDVSDVNGSSNDGLPEISRRQVSTTVRVASGETVAIGGLTQTQQHQVVRKVPILGDLPILAHLFRSTQAVEEETEILVFITPRLVEGRVGGGA